MCTAQSQVLVFVRCYDMTELASPEYIEQLRSLHERNQSFGVGNQTAKHYDQIAKIIKIKNIKTILDYGCGKGHFIEYVKDNFPDVSITGYDIANIDYMINPEGQYDLVVCLDVMEHIEYSLLANVLMDIKSKTSKLFISTIANYPAKAKLLDGRNAHLIQIPFGQWFTIISSFFRVEQFIRTHPQEGVFIASKYKSNADWR